MEKGILRPNRTATRRSTSRSGKFSRFRGAKQLFIAFFCYSAIETGTGLWAASYMVQYRGISESDAASWAALFYFGVMLGRAISGFVTGRLGDRKMIRIGQIVILAGILLLAIPGPAPLVCAGLLVIGLGCAPVYPQHHPFDPPTTSGGKPASRSSASRWPAPTAAPPLCRR